MKIASIIRNSLILLAVLALPALGVNYEPIIFEFAGLNLNSQSSMLPAKQLYVMNNFYGIPDPYSSERIGAITKTPYLINYLSTMPATGVGRGMTQFFYDYRLGGVHYLLVSQGLITYADGKLLLYDPSALAWHTLKEGSATAEFAFGSSYPTAFASNHDPFRITDTLYFTNGSKLKKYFAYSGGASLEVVSSFHDVNGTRVALSGASTFTFGSKVVSGAGTAYGSEVLKGSWINAAAGATWYEVGQVDNDVQLALRNAFAETTTTTATTSKAATATATTIPAHLVLWKNRLWMYNILSLTGNYSTSSLLCSAVQSSTTPAALETITGADTGYVDVPGDGVYGTGLASLDDYLFAFKDNNYSVYRYNASLLPPIELVRSWNYGCPAPRTIVRVENGLIYFTGSDVRYTTGFSDTSVAKDIVHYLKYTKDFSRRAWADYYAANANGNEYPFAIYDEYRKLYHLYLPSNNTTKTIELIYDTINNIWIGSDNANDNGYSMKVYHPVTTSTFEVASYGISGNNQLKLRKFFGGKTATTGEVQSGDYMFGDAKKQKRINWIEFWLHIPSGNPTNEATLTFNYWKDGSQGLTTALAYTLANTSSSEADHFAKLRFPVNTACNYFRWSLKDTHYSSSEVNSGAFSIVGGNIEYDFITGN